MLTRRGFSACALCAISSFITAGADAQNAATAGLKRTLLNQMDGPVDGYVTVSARVEIDPGAEVARHTHPGIESGYLVEGSLTLAIDGQGTRVLAAGDSFQVATRVPHGGKNGDSKAVLVSTYVVEKGKPLASPA
jgi:quercetin dioxygenase-like cupin family protein